MTRTQPTLCAVPCRSIPSSLALSPRPPRINKGHRYTTMSPISRLAVLLSALALMPADAATPAWIADWAANSETIANSVAGVADLEQSADAFAATMSAAIANGTSDTELTKLLMAFLVELDDDPRFQGFVASNTTASSTSSSSGSVSAVGSAGSASSGSNGATSAFSGLVVLLAVTLGSVAALAV